MNHYTTFRNQTLCEEIATELGWKSIEPGQPFGMLDWSRGPSWFFQLTGLTMASFLQEPYQLHLINETLFMGKAAPILIEKLQEKLVDMDIPFDLNCSAKIDTYHIEMEGIETITTVWADRNKRIRGFYEAYLNLVHHGPQISI